MAINHQSHQIIEPITIKIPANTFAMGTSEEQINTLAERDPLAWKWREKGFFNREQPLHSITLPGYSIGKYPVTVAEYRFFITHEGYHTQKYWTAAGWKWRKATERLKPDYWEDEIYTGDDHLPVVGVSLHEAMAYCRWLSEETGKHYRLPAEAEWELAARGTDGRIYPWGNAFDISRCNSRASALDKPTPVGHYSPDGDSPYGCADMVGNVSEWTVSVFKPYPSSGCDEWKDEEWESLRTLRGGSWFQPALRSRTACRGMNDPFFTDNDVGFRCLLVG